jgi:hypothetical protein
MLSCGMRGLVEITLLAARVEQRNPRPTQPLKCHLEGPIAVMPLYGCILVCICCLHMQWKCWIAPLSQYLHDAFYQHHAALQCSSYG